MKIESSSTGKGGKINIPSMYCFYCEIPDKMGHYSEKRSNQKLFN